MVWPANLRQNNRDCFSPYQVATNGVKEVEKSSAPSIVALYCSAGGSAGQKARNAKSVPFQSSSFFPQFISGKKSSLKTAQKIFIARRDD